MALGQGPDDAATYAALNWRDGEGRLFAAASFVARPEFLAAAQSPLARPAWDTGLIIDMDAAARAQATLQVGTDLVAQIDGLTAIVGLPSQQAIFALGLSRIPVDG